MRRKYKYLMLITIMGLISIILLISISFINHKLKLSKEDELFVPIGKIVEINDHRMHVYTEGKGKETLVFMSGGGTSSPVLDFKSLYSLLSHKYRVVVIEKQGYGFSEITESNRDIKTMLSETRKALLKSGVEGPYILFPHSMSGIEALHWAQVYPDEIKAIVGLDMAVPAAYENLDINMSLVQLGAFAGKIGLTRWIPGLSESDAIKYGTLTDEEEALYKAVFYRRTSTKDMINEIKSIKVNTQKVKESSIPKVPMLLFSSNGDETGFDKEQWVEIQNDFINKNANASLIELDSSHYIHNIDFEQIAEESKAFIKSLN